MYVASAGLWNFNPAFLRFSTSPVRLTLLLWRPGRGDTNELGKNGRQAVHKRQQITAGPPTLLKTSHRAQPWMQKFAFAAASSFAAQISALECMFEMRAITKLGDWLINGFHCFSRHWVVYGPEIGRSMHRNSNVATVAWIWGCSEPPTYWRYGIYTDLQFALPIPFFPLSMDRVATFGNRIISET